MRLTVALFFIFFLSSSFAQISGGLPPINQRSILKPSTTVIAANQQVEIKTNLGSIIIELNSDKAPKSVENFLQYVKDGHYKGTIFHRVIPNFMVQGGGFSADFAQKKTRPPIAIEANNGLRNDTGTVAMARTSDPNSATAQFFINHRNNDFLNHTAQPPLRPPPTSNLSLSKQAALMRWCQTCNE